MPMKIREVRVLPTHRRLRAKINSILLKPVENTPTVVKIYHGYNLIKGSHINFWNSFIFKTIDKIYPYIEKFPRFSSKIVNLAEKMIIQSK